MNDDSTSRRILVYAAVTGALGVLIGAFGAHGLPDFLARQGVDPETLTKRLAQFDTGARYHLVHATALFALASLGFGSPESRRWAARFFLAGIILFSGSLYLLVFTGITKFGMVTPLGGLSWIIGWATLAVVSRKSKHL
ncbi:hypothetical protein Pla22_00970 [Rubripirellula amarantea]|uniref:DUF423 domain-containing protein n=1 Tax=Rubripirellula amarantea TaxID=2527999 RepID=A0A5C5WR08_9BACT|nr:DUF423 domain-containing protein [Rubripirellula amarantea]TWT52473.1 hypothetical protein Pla22_00970 [Rubripirellula amarantea]